MCQSSSVSSHTAAQGFAEPVAPEIVQYKKLKYRNKKTPNIQRNVAGIVLPLPIPE
jgi:hypothetical protein